MQYAFYTSDAQAIETVLKALEEFQAWFKNWFPAILKA